MNVVDTIDRVEFLLDMAGVKDKTFQLLRGFGFDEESEELPVLFPNFFQMTKITDDGLTDLQILQVLIDIAVEHELDVHSTLSKLKMLKKTLEKEHV